MPPIPYLGRRPQPKFDIESEESHDGKPKKAKLTVTLMSGEDLVLDWDCDESSLNKAFTVIRLLAERLTRRHLDDDLDEWALEEELNPPW